MVAILILIVSIVNTVLLARLNKCGKVVHVKQEYTYIPAPRNKSGGKSWRNNYKGDEYE